MNSKPDAERLLRALANSRSRELVHLPYTEDFETTCAKIIPGATTAQKHELWEWFLSLRPVDPTVVEGPRNSTAPVTTTQQTSPRITASQTPPIGGNRYVPARDNSEFLFDVQPKAPEAQAWTAPVPPTVATETDSARQKLLADVARSELAKVEQRVAYLLQRFPETRDSDTALCIKYWRRFQADILEKWDRLDLDVLFELDRVETIGRWRRWIQNELQLFRGLADTHRARTAKQAELHEYIAMHRDSLTEVRFFLDETGNEGDKTYTGIGGVCITNWKQFEKHYAALELWRQSQGWPETIRFSDATAEKMERAIALLRELQARRAGVFFLGYPLESRGRTHHDLFSLYIQLVVDSLRHLRDCKCLPDNRRVRVIKEADTGFDSIYLDKLSKQLDEEVTREFPEQLIVLPVESVPKGRTVLLECADLIAGGMQRRALIKGRNPKDKLAEAIFNLTGFEDPTDLGAVFKFHGSPR